VASLQDHLNSPNQSVRLKAAFAAGTFPNAEHVPILIAQCGTEVDFFVRDTLSWALMRHDRTQVVDSLIPELKSSNSQSRSQALHTLSKIGDKANYQLISTEHLLDSDDSVASTAWRAASVLVPDDQKPNLVKILVTQLGRGDGDTQFGLTRFLCTIGQEIVEPLRAAAQTSDGPYEFTQKLL